jgi:hypothetical protein
MHEILSIFLTNRSDSRDIEASHFGGAYKPPAHRELDGLKQKLHYQILHLGKRRQGELDRQEKLRDSRLHDGMRRDRESRFTKPLHSAGLLMMN